MLNRSSAWLLFVVSGSSVDAFTPSKVSSLRSTVSPLRSTILEPKVNGVAEPTTWECDEVAQCVEVPVTKRHAGHRWMFVFTESGMI
jgi:hypothetical protein